jgi:hypothetical protein
MRTEKELLQILLDNMNLFTTGLCILSWRLSNDEIITQKEEEFIDEYISSNLLHGRFGYAFPRGEREPRIKWLKQQIKQLEK